jgi:acyl-coenzyme A synthetase/AMP-(fatty) acid ligase
VEKLLEAIPAVAEAIVLASSNNHLEAHIVPVEGHSINSQEFRRQINVSLPAEMVPRAIIFHQQFPLTDRGKTDRNALRREAQTLATAIEEGR